MAEWFNFTVDTILFIHCQGNWKGVYHFSMKLYAMYKSNDITNKNKVVLSTRVTLLPIYVYIVCNVLKILHLRKRRTEWSIKHFVRWSIAEGDGILMLP